MMDSKANEFLKQINREIKNREEELEQAKKYMHEQIDYSHNTEFAKYAERIGILKGKIEVLKDQRNIFSAIFID